MVLAGCDPAMGLAAALLPPKGPHRLVAIPACSRRGLEALKARRIHMAVVNGSVDAPRANFRVDGRVLLAKWRVGLASRMAHKPDLERIASGDLTVAHRGAGVEIQRTLVRILEPLGGSARLTGAIATGHIDAVRHAAYGWCDYALTIEAAAMQYGLEFWPLAEHQVELHIGLGCKNDPGVTGLLELIATRHFRARLEVLGGYDLSDAGKSL